MTKPKTDFAEDDHAIARRALWVLQGRKPGRQQPPADLDLNLLTTFTGDDGFLVPLAHFALVRNADAIRAAAQPATTEEQQDSPNLRVAHAKQRVEAQLAAARAEKKANAELREAVFRVGNAAAEWRAAATNRAEDVAHTPSELLTGEHEEILGALVVAQKSAEKALKLMDGSMRQVPPDNVTSSFPSTLGMPKSERNEALNEQAARLEDGGISVEVIAYVMGWNDGTTEQAKDRTRKRIEAARERTALARG